ncbi:MAG: efflux RND transporter periplasmic adaptor subunit [Magnetococcales bacterium]|nr:efflux RND transporter periplasmic adaptor subunit [Magnetococcales bacterium]
MHQPAHLIIILVAVYLITPAALLANERTAKGIIEAAQEAVLSSEMAGHITRMTRQEGERFSKGDLLVRFACDLQRAEQQIAVVQSHAAKVKQKHIQHLDQLGSAGKIELSIAEADRAESEARVALAKAKTRRCTVHAPFSGVVISRFIKPHESVDIHSPLLHVVDDTQFEVVIIAPTHWLTWIKPGVRFTFHSPAQNGKPLPGHIIRTGLAVDPSSQTVAIRGMLDKNSPILRPGLGGTIRFADQATP